MQALDAYVTKERAAENLQSACRYNFCLIDVTLPQFLSRDA